MRIQREVCRYRLVAKPLTAREPETLMKSDETYKFLMSYVYDKENLGITESFYAVFLNAGNMIKGFIKVSEGGVNNCLADPKIIFSAALKCLATSIILTHNHPSGNPRPSECDKELTKKLEAGAKLLDINIMDHIIVANGGRYFSFRDHGIIY